MVVVSDRQKQNKSLTTFPFSKTKINIFLAANFLVENVLLLESSLAYSKIKKMLPLAADFFCGESLCSLSILSSKHRKKTFLTADFLLRNLLMPQCTYTL